MPLSHRAPRAPRLLLVAAGIILAAISAIALVSIAQAGRILPGVSVVGVDLGGRDPWSARRVLEPALEQEGRRPVAVSVPGQQLHVRPAHAGVRFDVERTVAAAFGYGRQGARGLIGRLLVGVVRHPVAPLATVDDAALTAWLEEAAARIERTASVGDFLIDRGALSVDVLGPHGAIVVDHEASLARLRAALVDPAVPDVELVTSTTAPPSTWAEIEGLGGQVEAALRAPIRLEHEGRRLLIEPTELAQLVTVEESDTPGGVAPRLTVPTERVERLLGERARTVFDIAAEDARITTPDEPPVQLTDLSSTTFAPLPAEISIIPGRSQATFRARPVAEQLARMVSGGVRREEAVLDVVPPAITTADVATARPTHLLGTFTTFHPAGTPRSANIRLLADLLDGQLVAPGEEFSVNATSGPRRCEDGFVPAGTIIRGELVDTCGGGISQFGTTLMNAVFFAGLPLEQWQPHSFFISRYPAGREATLSYPELDVRFLNDTDGWVVLRTSHTPDSITVALYGVPRWGEVRAFHTDRRSPTTFDEVVRPTTTLPPGARRVLQSGGGGFTLTVTRTRIPIAAGTDPSIERWTTVYLPQQRIVEVGVEPAAVSPDAAPAVVGPQAAVGATTGD